MKYIKKPVIIEAIQFDGYNVEEIKSFCNGNCITGFLDKVIIKTLRGNIAANIGDYVVEGDRGDLYPCKPDIFEETYEEFHEKDSEK